MEAVEPVKFEIEGGTLDLPEYSPRLNKPNNSWDETPDFLFHKALEEDFKEISQKTIISEYNDVLDEKFTGPEQIIDELQDEITTYRYPPVHTFTPVYYMGGVVCIPNVSHSGIFYMVSNNKNKLRSVRDSVVEKLENSPDDYGAMGLEGVNVFYGSDFTLRSIEDVEHVDCVETGSADDFESRIYEDVEPISEAFVHNVSVEFDSPQNPEYDILFSLSPGNTISIEVEDHSGTDSVPGEDDLIDGPSGESDYINAAKVFTVCNGVESERMGELSLKTKLKNVDIVEKDQIADRIKNYIADKMILDGVSVQR